MARPGNVLRISRSRQSLGHPAAFGVGLPTFFLEAFSDKADVVFDPFLGSGTTLIAAHRTGRRCLGCEISPQYADLILKRAEAEGIQGIQLLSNGPGGVDLEEETADAV